jgi:flagellar hook protein FlgE
MNMTAGSSQSTSYPLDFAISGEGFFVVSTGDGICYTRNGALTLDADGYLVTANGDYVMAGSGDATAVADGTSTAGYAKIKLLGSTTDSSGTAVTYVDYAVDSNGTITATTDSDTTVTIGRLVLATFNNPGGLEKTGSSYYTASTNSGTATINYANDDCGSLDSGSLEMSNVDLATELTNMIVMQRGFQANSRVITTSDTMLEELINLKR